MPSPHLNSTFSKSSSSNSRKAAAWAWHLHSGPAMCYPSSSSPPSAPSSSDHHSSSIIQPAAALQSCIQGPYSDDSHRDSDAAIGLGPAHHHIQADYIDYHILPTVNRRVRSAAAEAQTIMATGAEAGGAAATIKKSSSVREFSRFRREAQRSAQIKKIKLLQHKDESMEPSNMATVVAICRKSTSTSSAGSDVTSLHSDGDDRGNAVISRTAHPDGYASRVWDCGSSLYDAFEVVSFSDRIERNINYWLDIFDDDDHGTSGDAGDALAKKYIGSTASRRNQSTISISIPRQQQHQRHHHHHHHHHHQQQQQQQNHHHNHQRNARADRPRRWATPFWLAKLSTRIGSFVTKSTNRKKLQQQQQQHHDHHIHHQIHRQYDSYDDQPHLNTEITPNVPYLHHRSYTRSSREFHTAAAITSRISGSGNRTISNSAADEQ